MTRLPWVIVIDAGLKPEALTVTLMFPLSGPVVEVAVIAGVGEVIGGGVAVVTVELAIVGRVSVS